MANLTPIQWYCKKQATSETTTYCAEFLAARTCVEQVVDLRNSFRYLGTPVFGTSYAWGDNEAQIVSSIVPYARLNKRHQILSFHFVRSLISKGFISIRHLNSQWNVTDVLSKHWSHQACYRRLIKPLSNHHEYHNPISIDELKAIPSRYDFVPVDADGE